MLHEQQVGHKRKELGVDVRPAARGFLDGDRNLPPVLFRGRRTATDVGSIYAKASGDLADSLPQLAASPIAVTPVAIADVDHQVGQAFKVGRELGGDDLVLAGANHLGERLRLAGKRVIESGHRRFVGRVDEEAVDMRNEVIAGRALNRKGVRHLLAGGQDVFDHDVRAGSCVAQASQVLHRVSQAVDVIDAESGHAVVCYQSQDHAVTVVENLLVLDPQGSCALRQ